MHVYQGGERSFSRQEPMSLVARGQARWGDSPRRNRPDTWPQHPVRRPRANSRAVPKGKVWRRDATAGRLLLGESGEGGGRVTQSMMKAEAAVDAWACEAVVTPGVASLGTRGRGCAERMRSREAGGRSAAVGEGIRRDNAEVPGPMPHGKSEGAIVAMMAGTTEPAGAKVPCLSRASHGGGAA